MFVKPNAMLLRQAGEVSMPGSPHSEADLPGAQLQGALAEMRALFRNFKMLSIHMTELVQAHEQKYSGGDVEELEQQRDRLLKKLEAAKPQKDKDTTPVNRITVESPQNATSVKRVMVSPLHERSNVDDEHEPQQQVKLRPTETKAVAGFLNRAHAETHNDNPDPGPVEMSRQTSFGAQIPGWKEQTDGVKKVVAPRRSQLPPPEPRSRLAKFVLSSRFDRLTAALLLSNAGFIGVQVESSFQPTTPFWIDIFDYIFCALFQIELCLKLWALGCARYWCSREDWYWNAFDFFIVFTSTLDAVMSIIVKANGQDTNGPLANISVLRVIRIVRIVRVLRIIRVMKFFQDLRILLMAIFSTLKTASFAFILISLIMYMFGIAITQLVAQHVVDNIEAGTPLAKSSEVLIYFGSIGNSILTMFMTISGGIDWQDGLFPLYDVGVLAVVFFLLYISLMTLCVMNVLLGIFCQCAIDTAAQDNENVIAIQLQEKNRFVKTLRKLFQGWDESGNGTCSVEEFEKHIWEEKTQALLKSLDIESRDALTLFGFLDSDGSGQVDLDEFISGCITLRGGAKAIHFEKLAAMHQKFNSKIEQMQDEMKLLQNAQPE